MVTYLGLIYFKVRLFSREKNSQLALKAEPIVFYRDLIWRFLLKCFVVFVVVVVVAAVVAGFYFRSVIIDFSVDWFSSCKIVWK